MQLNEIDYWYRLIIQPKILSIVELSHKFWDNIHNKKFAVQTASFNGADLLYKHSISHFVDIYT